MIENLENIIDCLEKEEWDEAKNIAKNSIGATFAINAIKYLQKNVDMKKEIEKIRLLKENFLKLVEGHWVQEFDIDYFTVIFAYFERQEKRLQEAAYVKSIVKDPDKE
ncbi:MAG: hypothetical protein N3F64_00315 [Nitrososphaeria archaeon]|nr:hypothetical protein [Nitrososphaeria archaeon]